VGGRCTLANQIGTLDTHTIHVSTLPTQAGRARSSCVTVPAIPIIPLDRSFLPARFDKKLGDAKPLRTPSASVRKGHGRGSPGPAGAVRWLGMRQKRHFLQPGARAARTWRAHCVWSRACVMRRRQAAVHSGGGVCVLRATRVHMRCECRRHAWRQRPSARAPAPRALGMRAACALVWRLRSTVRARR
jgi:hypothetical protein